MTLKSETNAPLETPKSSRTRKTKGPKLTQAQAFEAALAKAGHEARRRAAAILEVLAGTRKPSEAAQALGLSPMRYYLIERRAIRALVEGCKNPPKGRTVTPEDQLHKLQKQVRRLEREGARYAALARVARTAVHLAAPPPLGKSASGAKKARRRPPLRALKVAGKLIESAVQVSIEPSQETRSSNADPRAELEVAKEERVHE